MIGDSPPAPLLTLIVGPSEEGREVGEVKKNRAERHQIFRRFWGELLERAKTQTKLYNSVSPGDYDWIGTSAGKRGLGLNFGIVQHGATAELYIDRGRDAEAENRRIFDALHARKDEIERAYGGELTWMALEGKRACRIVQRFQGVGYRDDESRLPELQDRMVDAMVRLERALRPHIAQLPSA